MKEQPKAAMIKSITIQAGQTEVALTQEEAIKLFHDLKQIFGQESKFVPIPAYPYLPDTGNPNWWQYPYTICGTLNSTSATLNSADNG